MCKLVLSLNLKCFVFADFDYLLRDKGEEREKYNAKPHESISSLGEAFFSQDCILGANGQKMHKRIQKARSHLKKENEAKFYCAKEANEFDDQRLLVFLTELRKCGVGILNSELEGLFKIKEMLHGSKITLETIFDLNSRLTNGENVSDLVETTEIIEFLEAVFLG